MHVYQMRSSVPSVVTASQERINICMQALKDVSKVWLVARMVHTLFESILGNKALEERLQKAAGKRHQRTRQPQVPKRTDPPKRKFDEMDMSMPNGPPAPQVSYERSRPQTPAATPSMPPASLATSATAGLPNPSPATAQQQRVSNDAFLGTTNTGSTRPGTPFNPSFSIPATPPDLFLVTRNSPNLSQSIWENFQPDQLFPDGTNMSYPGFSPSSANVDPQLSMPHMQGSGAQSMGVSGQQQMSRGGRGEHESPTMMQSGMSGMGGNMIQGGMGMQHQGWPMQSMDGNVTVDSQSQDDNWSNSSRSGGPVVPPTLNVEDWYVPTYPHFCFYILWQLLINPSLGSNSSGSTASTICRPWRTCDLGLLKLLVYNLTF